MGFITSYFASWLDKKSTILLINEVINLMGEKKDATLYRESGSI